MGVYQTIDNVLEAEITPSAKLVAIALFRHENRKTGLCFPSVSTICELTGLKITAVKTALKVLKEEGMIDWVSRVPKFGNSKTNHYSLLFVDRSESDHMNDQTNNHITNQSANRTANQSANRTANQSPNQSESDYEQIEPYKQKEQVGEHASSQMPLCPIEESHADGIKGRCPAEYHPLFEAWWKAYPKRNGKKQGKRKAFEAWWKACRDEGVTPDRLIEAITKLSPTYGEYPPDGATWLNGRRWEDENEDESEYIVHNGRRMKRPKNPNLDPSLCDDEGNFDVNRIL
jgi:hypothetical protein